MRRLIIEVQGGESKTKYGNGLIKEWSKELTNLYGKCYNYTNLSRMRQLYLTFQIELEQSEIPFEYKRRKQKKLLYKFMYKTKYRR